MESRQKCGICSWTSPQRQESLRRRIKEKNQDRVKEGIEMLEKAINLRKDYDDAWPT